MEFYFIFPIVIVSLFVIVSCYSIYKYYVTSKAKNEYIESNPTKAVVVMSGVTFKEKAPVNINIPSMSLLSTVSGTVYVSNVEGDNEHKTFDQRSFMLDAGSYTFDANAHYKKTNIIIEVLVTVGLALFRIKKRGYGKSYEVGPLRTTVTVQTGKKYKLFYSLKTEQFHLEEVVK